MTTDKGNAALRMRELNARAKQERTALTDTFAVVRQRLRPARLASEAGDRVADAVLDTIAKGRNTARQHPFKAIGIAAVIGAFLARRPLFGLLSQGIGAAWRHFQERRGHTAADAAADTDDPVTKESEEPHGP